MSVLLLLFLSPVQGSFLFLPGLLVLKSAQFGLSKVKEFIYFCIQLVWSRATAGREVRPTDQIWRKQIFGVWFNLFLHHCNVPVYKLTWLTIMNTPIMGENAGSFPQAKSDSCFQTTQRTTDGKAVAHNRRLADLGRGLDSPPYRVCSAT